MADKISDNEEMMSILNTIKQTVRLPMDFSNRSLWFYKDKLETKEEAYQCLFETILGDYHYDIIYQQIYDYWENYKYFLNVNQSDYDINNVASFNSININDIIPTYDQLKLFGEVIYDLLKSQTIKSYSDMIYMVNDMFLTSYLVSPKKILNDQLSDYVTDVSNMSDFVSSIEN
jgi:hypothetical protein